MFEWLYDYRPMNFAGAHIPLRVADFIKGSELFAANYTVKVKLVLFTIRLEFAVETSEEKSGSFRYSSSAQVSSELVFDLSGVYVHQPACQACPGGVDHCEGHDLPV